MEKSDKSKIDPSAKCDCGHEYQLHGLLLWGLPDPNALVCLVKRQNGGFIDGCQWFNQSLETLVIEARKE